jgi:hypothetical protein
MKMVLLLLFVCTQVYAQSTATAPSNTNEATFPALSWDRIKARTKIYYFNFATGPSLKKWDDNEISDQGTKNREPATMYHSFNVRYNLAGALDLFVIPRVATPMGDRNDLKDNQDHHVLMPDDWDFGFYYTFINGHSFNYAQSLTNRIPYSVKSQNEQIDSMVIWQHLVTWAITPAIRILHWSNYSYYAFNQDSTIERYRMNWRTIVNYAFNDKWNTQLSYELDMQHINPKDSSSPKHRDLSYMKRYHSYPTLGIGYSPYPTWMILPYIRSLDERNIRNETTVLGFMVLGKVI